MPARIIPLHRLSAYAVCLQLFVACSDPSPVGPHGEPQQRTPLWLINGTDDADRSAVASVMVFDRFHPEKPGWRPFCTATLIHQRVLTTAGHCIQGIARQVAVGRLEAVWVSFQQDPLAHFNTPPADADPAGNGWYEIESLHNNPDNPEFTAPPPLLPGWPDLHDSGAITLKHRARGIQPMRMPKQPDEVATLLARAGCAEGVDCGLVAVGYGLMEFPVLQPPPLQVRQSATLLFSALDPHWVKTLSGAPGTTFGAACFGDSGGPLVLLKKNGRDRIITSMISGPENPFGFPCTGVATHYRVDTQSHLDFIREVILQSLGAQS